MSADRSGLTCVQVFVVLVCMAVIISKTEINWGQAFDGFVPSKTLLQSGGLYTCAWCSRVPLHFLSFVTYVTDVWSYCGGQL